MPWSDEETSLALAYGTYAEYVRAGGTASHQAWKSKRKRPRPELSAESEDEPIGFRPRQEDEDLRAYWEAQKAAIAAAHRRLARRSQRIIAWQSPDDRPQGICFYGDTHIGSMGIDAHRLEADLLLMEQAVRELGIKLVFMGDANENAKITGKAAPSKYEEAITSPLTQMDVTEMLHRPLAGAFLAWLSGNHDDGRDFNTSGISRIPDLAESLDAPYVSEAGCMLHLEIGFQRYTIYAKHDWGGKSRINKSNSLRRFWEDYPEFENADVAVLAHTHEPLLEQVQKKGRRVTWIRTGSWKVHDPYAEKAGFKPEPGVGFVILYGKERRIDAALDLEDGIERLRFARAKT